MTIVAVPYLGVFAAFISPVVLYTYLTSPQRTKSSDIMFMVALVATAIYSPRAVIYYVLTVGSAALTVFYSMRHDRYRTWLPVVAGPLPVFISTFLMVYIIPYTRNLWQGYMQSLFQMIIEAAQKGQAGANSHYVAIVKNNLEYASLSAALIMPGLQFALVAVMSFVTMKYALKKAGFEASVFRIPDNLVWGLLAGGFMIMFANVYLRAFALTTVFAYTSLYFFQGLSIMGVWADKLKINEFFRMLFLLLIVIQMPLMLGVALVGVFSIWFNFTGRTKGENIDKSG